jgi:hypothetical protein
MQDKNNSEFSYNINTSAELSEVTGIQSTISWAASQQTIIYRSATRWHLL